MNNKHKHAGHIITIEGHSFKSNESVSTTDEK